MAVAVKAGRQWGEWGARVLLFLVMVIPASLRYNIGTDYASYAMIYTSSSVMVDYVEPGYALLNYLLRHAGADVQWLFAIVAAITYAPIAFGVRKRWIVPVVAIYMLTVYLSTYSLIRQNIAIAWVMVALLRFLDDQHLGRLYFWIVLASFIHLSAVLVLPFVLIRRVHISMWWILLLLPVAYYAASHGLIDSLFASSTFQESKYGVYATNQFSRKTAMGTGLGVMLKMLIPFAFFFLSPKLDRKYDSVLYLLAAYVVSLMFSMQVHIFNRLVDIFSFSPVVGFAIMSKERRKPLLVAALFVLLLLNFQKTIVSNTSAMGSGLGITPYVTIFEK